MAVYCNESVADPCSAIRYLLHHKPALKQLVETDVNMVVMLLETSEIAKQGFEEQFVALKEQIENEENCLYESKMELEKKQKPFSVSQARPDFASDYLS